MMLVALPLSFQRGNSRMSPDDVDIWICENKLTLYTWVVDDPPNPREIHDNLGKLYCWHRLYVPGDQHEYRNQEALWESLINELGRFAPRLRLTKPLNSNDGEYWYEEVWRHADKFGYVIFPISLHASKPVLTLHNLLGPIVGWYIVNPESANRFCPIKYPVPGWRKIQDHVETELRTYSYYANGEVYGYWLEDDWHNGGHVIDSQVGFYGPDHFESGLFHAAGIKLKDGHG